MDQASFVRTWCLGMSCIGLTKMNATSEKDSRCAGVSAASFSHQHAELTPWEFSFIVTSCQACWWDFLSRGWLRWPGDPAIRYQRLQSLKLRGQGHVRSCQGTQLFHCHGHWMARQVPAFHILYVYQASASLNLSCVIYNWCLIYMRLQNILAICMKSN